MTNPVASVFWSFYSRWLIYSYDLLHVSRRGCSTAPGDPQSPEIKLFSQVVYQKTSKRRCRNKQVYLEKSISKQPHSEERRFKLVTSEPGDNVHNWLEAQTQSRVWSSNRSARPDPAAPWRRAGTSAEEHLKKKHTSETSMLGLSEADGEDRSHLKASASGGKFSQI